MDLFFCFGDYVPQTANAKEIAMLKPSYQNKKNVKGNEKNKSMNVCAAKAIVSIVSFLLFCLFGSQPLLTLRQK